MAKKSITKAKVKKKIVKVQKQKQKQGQTINISINSNNQRKQSQSGQSGQPPQPPQNRRPLLQQPNIILNMQDRNLINQDPLMFNLAKQFENIKNTQEKVLNQLTRQDIKEAQQSYLINQGTNLLSKMNESDPNNERLSQMEAMIARNRERIAIPNDDGISVSFDLPPKPPMPPPKPSGPSGAFAPTRSQLESVINKLKPTKPSKSVGDTPLNPLVTKESLKEASARLKPISQNSSMSLSVAPKYDKYLFSDKSPSISNIEMSLSKADESGARALEAVSRVKSLTQRAISNLGGTIANLEKYETNTNPSVQSSKGPGWMNYVGTQLNPENTAKGLAAAKADKEAEKAARKAAKESMTTTLSEVERYYKALNE